MHQLTNRPCEHFPVNTKRPSGKGICLFKAAGCHLGLYSRHDRFTTSTVEFFYGQKHPGKPERNVQFSKKKKCPLT